MGHSVDFNTANGILRHITLLESSPLLHTPNVRVVLQVGTSCLHIYSSACKQVTYECLILHYPSSRSIPTLIPIDEVINNIAGPMRSIFYSSL